MWKKLLPMIVVIGMGVFTLGIKSSHAQAMLYTPYTGVSITPGENITYSVDVVNESDVVDHFTFAMNKLPDAWDYSILADGKSIEQLSIRPNSEENITVTVEVPLEVDKGTYNFELAANGNEGQTTLPFIVNVTEKGSFKTEFTVDQPNMEGHADADFNYKGVLRNLTADEQQYALSAQAPDGWTVQFKANGNSVTSVTVEPNESQDVEISVIPAENVTAETYTIPIKVTGGSFSEEIELETVITGMYKIELTTPSGNLSSDITAGGKKSLDLVVKNTGTAELLDVELSANTPPNWDVSFNKDSIPQLEAGDSATIKATVEAPGDMIAGDYVATIEAGTAQVSDQATFRISVKTSTLWGLIGVGIIVGVLAGLYFVFKKFGRR